MKYVEEKGSHNVHTYTNCQMLYLTIQNFIILLTQKVNVQITYVSTQ